MENIWNELRERVRNDDDIKKIKIKRKPFTFQLFALIMIFSLSLFSLFLLSFSLSLFNSFSLSLCISLSLLFPNKTFVWVGKLDLRKWDWGFQCFDFVFHRTRKSNHITALMLMHHPQNNLPLYSFNCLNNIFSFHLTHTLPFPSF